MPKITKVKVYLNGKMAPIVYRNGKYEIDSFATITDSELRRQLLDIVKLLESF